MRFSKGERDIIRKETAVDLENLKKEIIWILDLPQELKPFFPEVLDYNLSSPPFFYDMPYYKLSTLRQLLINNRIDSEDAINIIEDITRFAFTKLYNINKEKVTSENIIYPLHIKRIKDRLKAIREQSNTLKLIIDSEKIKINDDSYINILPLIDKIEFDEDLLEMLNPEFVSMIHGDFHFSNFLIDPAKENFILIDPRGEKRGFDWAYDIGKLWWSIHGLFDFISENLFSMNLKIDGFHVVANFEIKRNKTFYRFKEIEESYLPILEKCVNDYGDSKQWLLRLSFIEAFHFCSIAPFHLEDNLQEERVCARYLTGVKLLNECFEEYKEVGKCIKG